MACRIRPVPYRPWRYPQRLEWYPADRSLLCHRDHRQLLPLRLDQLRAYLEAPAV